jgi:Secretion system C-terminal sorting domain
MKKQGICIPALPNQGRYLRGLVSTLILALIAIINAFCQPPCSNNRLAGSTSKAHTRYGPASYIVQLLDSTVVERYNGSTGQWAVRWKEIFSYSSGGRLEQMIYGSWMKTEGDRNKYKEDYTYDTAGQLTLTMGCRWDTTAGQWVNHYRQESFYDTEGNRICLVSYFWHSDEELWAEDFMYEYSYDDKGNMILEIYKVWDEDNGEWMNYGKYVFTNDEEGTCTQFIRYQWDGISSEWMVLYEYVYIFNDDSREIGLMITGWDNTLGQWFNSSKCEYSLDDNGNKILELDYVWDTISDEWVYSTKYDYDYDVNGNVTFYMYDRWNKDQYRWDNVDRGFNYYSMADITDIAGNASPMPCVWPNPADDYVVIEIREAGPVWIEICDMQGRIVASQQLNGNKEVPVHNLCEGIYLYVIHGRNRISGKVVIRR